METSAKPAAPAAQIALAKKAAAAKAKAKPSGLSAPLIAANRKHRTKQALAGTPDLHSEHDQTRVHAPRAPPQTPAKEKARAQKERIDAAKARLAERLLTKPEVCAIAHVSYPTLWQWMLAGKFPRSRIVAGRSMWLATEVETWLAELPIRPLKGDDQKILPSSVV